MNRYATWLDTLGLDSQYNYDPVWTKCVELKVTPTFHTASQGVGARASYSNFVYNHIGHFAAAGEAVCKSLFLNGVTRRFPTLKFAFLFKGSQFAKEIILWGVRGRLRHDTGGKEDPEKCERRNFLPRVAYETDHQGLRCTPGLSA